MDGRNSSLGIITKQWPKRRNKFQTLFGFSEGATLQEPRETPPIKNNGMNFFEEQQKKMLSAAYLEKVADQHMDIASGKITPIAYIGKTLSQAEKYNHYHNAYDNYLLAIQITQKQEKQVSLDLYFSYINALELATHVAPELKTELLSKMMTFIFEHALSQKIKEANCGTGKKNEYNELLHDYIQIYQHHSLSLNQTRFTG